MCNPHLSQQAGRRWWNSRRRYLGLIFSSTIASAAYRGAQWDSSAGKDRQIRKCFRASRREVWRAAATDAARGVARTAQKEGGAANASRTARRAEATKGGGRLASLFFNISARHLSLLERRKIDRSFGY